MCELNGHLMPCTSCCYYYSAFNMPRVSHKDEWMNIHTHRYTHTCLTALFPGLPGWAGTRKVKPMWILLKQETVSSSGISWAICKSAPRSRQITMPARHHSVFNRPDALPAAQPTASKHWRHWMNEYIKWKIHRTRRAIRPLTLALIQQNIIHR